MSRRTTKGRSQDRRRRRRGDAWWLLVLGARYMRLRARFDRHAWGRSATIIDGREKPPRSHERAACHGHMLALARFRAKRQTLDRPRLSKRYDDSILGFANPARHE